MEEEGGEGNGCGCCPPQPCTPCQPETSVKKPRKSRSRSPSKCKSRRPRKRSSCKRPSRSRSKSACKKRKRSRSRSSSKRKKSKCGVRPGPMTNNGYLNFLRWFRRKNVGMNAREIVKRGARMWCSLSAEEKAPYRRMVR